MRVVVGMEWPQEGTTVVSQSQPPLGSVQLATTRLRSSSQPRTPLKPSLPSCILSGQPCDSPSIVIVADEVILVVTGRAVAATISSANLNLPLSVVTHGVSSVMRCLLGLITVEDCAVKPKSAPGA